MMKLTNHILRWTQLCTILFLCQEGSHAESILLTNATQSRKRSTQGCRGMNRCIADKAIDQNPSTFSSSLPVPGTTQAWWSAQLTQFTIISKIHVYLNRHHVGAGHLNQFAVQTKKSKAENWSVCKGEYRVSAPLLPHVVRCDSPNTTNTVSKFIKLSASGSSSIVLALFEVQVFGIPKPDADHCRYGCDRHAHCKNNNGTFNCTCEPGWQGNGFNCTDINECVSGTSQLPPSNVCHHYSNCINTIGSYKCKCDHGYVGNGTHCQESPNPCALRSTPCTNYSTCAVMVNGTTTCECVSGRYRSVINGTCVKGAHTIQVQGLVLDRPYKDDYEDLTSQESLILISTIQSSLLKLMKSNSSLGRVVGRVQVTRLYQGSVKVDFLAVLTEPLSQPSQKIAGLIHNAIEKQQSIIVDMGVKNDSIIVAKEAGCGIGSFVRDGVCTSVQEHTRGILRFIRQRSAWREELKDQESKSFLQLVKLVSKEFSADLREQVSNAKSIKLGVNIMELNEAAERNAGIEITASIVYDIPNNFTASDRLLLCDQLKNIERLSGERNITQKSTRKYVDFKYASYDCCYSEDSSLGERNFKGKYTFDTTWVNDVNSQECVYTEGQLERGNVTRKCLAVVEEGMSKPARWEEGKEVESLSSCEAKYENTRILEELKRKVETDPICAETDELTSKRDSCTSSEQITRELQTVTNNVEEVLTPNWKAVDVEVDNEDIELLKKENVSIGLRSTFEVDFVKDSLENIFNRTTYSLNWKMNDVIMDIISNVMETDVNLMRKAEKRTKCVSEILNHTRKIIEKLSADLTTSTSVNLSTPNIAALAVRLSPNVDQSELTFTAQVNDAGNMIIEPASGTEIETTVTQEPTVEVSIPTSTWTSVGDVASNIVLEVFGKPSLFVSADKEQVINSDILGVSLGTEDVVVKVDAAARLRFKKRYSDTEMVNITCAYWRESNSSEYGKFGVWDTEGCVTESQTTKEVVCACTRLGYFALIGNREPTYLSSPCHYGYFMHDGYCTSVKEASRGTLTFKSKEEWKSKMDEKQPNLFFDYVNEVDINGLPAGMLRGVYQYQPIMIEYQTPSVGIQFRNTYRAGIRFGTIINLSMHVTGLKVKRFGTNTVPDVVVTVDIVYFLPQHFTQENKLKLCADVQAKRMTRNKRGFHELIVASYDCCYDSSTGEEGYKGSYSYTTAWVGDIITKQCAYPQDDGSKGSFTRQCEAVPFQAAKWESGRKIENLPTCETKYETTRKLEALRQTTYTRLCEDTGGIPGRGTCVSIAYVVRQLRTLTSSYSNTTQGRGNGNQRTRVRRATQAQGMMCSQELEIVTDIIKKVGNTASVDTLVQAKDNMMYALSNTFQTSIKVIDIAKERDDIPNKLLKQVDIVVEKLSEGAKENASIVIKTPNVGGLLTKTPEAIDRSSSFDFHLDIYGRNALVEQIVRGEEKERTWSRQTGQVLVPLSTLTRLSNFSGVLNVVTYMRYSMFRSTEKAQQVNSLIVGISAGSKHRKVKGTPAVRVHLKKRYQENDGKNISCAYWKEAPTKLCWTHHQMACINDNNMRRYKGQTPSECQRKCASHPLCTAIEYGAPHGGSNMEMQPKDCILKSLNETCGCDGKEKNTDVFIKNECGDDIRDSQEVTEQAGGRWETDGCYIEGYAEDGRIVKCACNQFGKIALIVTPEEGEVLEPSTNLALLLSTSGTVGEGAEEISIISIVGGVFSLIGLTITVLAHGCMKKLRTRLPSQILICFSSSLSFLLILVLAGMTRTDEPLTCQVLGGLIQYAMLSSFTWMNINAISLYQAIVLVFKRNEKKFFIRANIYAWGAPAIIVAVSSIVSPESYLPCATNKRYCFVDGYPLYFGVLLPVGVIILMNLIILVIMLVTLHRKPHVTATKEEKSELKEGARIAITCSILLGLPWVFGFLANVHPGLEYTLQLLFVIFNAFQGFFVFLLYTINNKVILNEIRRRKIPQYLAEKFSTSHEAMTSSSVTASEEHGEVITNRHQTSEVL